MKAIKLSILAAFMVLLAGCQEEIWPNGRVEEGIPTSLDFTVSVPAAEEVTVTRASVADYESEIRELMLIMFEAGGRKMVIDVTPYMDNGAAGTIENGHRIYKLTRPIDQDMYGGPVLTGTYKVYAVANWSGSFAGLTNLDQLSEEELVDQIAQNTGFVYSISGTERFPMSSITEDVNIEPEGSSLSLKLKRLTSRIEFTFKNGSSTVDGKAENPNFTPTSYTIYNIPAKANLFSKADNKITNGTFGKSEPISLTSKEFEFFMLENVQTAKQPGCDSQKEREHWTGGNTNSTTAPEDKNFVYAPDNGTFIVVSGTYNGASYIGDVSYTIHLGNFSEGTNTDNGKDFSNFKVNRNERQKYTVTVNGVKSIATEVTTDSEVHPGVEGSLTEISENTFVLDAHYEQVMMKITGLGSPAYLFVDSPYCRDNNGNALVNLAAISESELNALGLDYKWVQFMAPSSASEFPTFKKADSGNVWQLIQDINDGGDAKYYSVIDGELYTAAFVDEFFYETAPDGSATDWTQFVNTDNRTLSIRPGIQHSEDGNSSLVQDSHIEISQRSIKTTYAFNGADPNGGVYVPFGIETWDETGKNYFHGTSQTGNNGNNWDLDGLTENDGWGNTKILIANETAPLNRNKAGYLESIYDNSKESHVYADYVELSSRAKGSNACALRNRDEGGDGLSDNELKWYLPAVQQYRNIWLSVDQLHEDTQLFNREDVAGLESLSTSQKNSLNMSAVYYTSSPYAARLYWGLEGASYGQAYGSSYDNPTNGVRCVRNLTSSAGNGTYSGEPSLLTEFDQSSLKISASNISAVRQTLGHVGEYAIRHNERSNENKLPSAFIVAKKYLGEDVPAGKVVTIPETTWLKISRSDGNRQSDPNNNRRYIYTINLVIDPIEGDKYVCEGMELNSENGYTYSHDYTNQTSSTTKSFDISIQVTKADGRTREMTVTATFRNSSFQSVTPTSVETPAEEQYTDVIKTGKQTGNKDTFAANSFDPTDLCSKGYYEQADRSDLGYWRVPNQRELMLMLQYNLLISTSSEGATSSTWVSGSTSSWKPQPFGTYNGGITLDNRASSIYVRCVMDASSFGNDSDNSGNQGDNGNNGSGGDNIEDEENGGDSDNKEDNA